MLPPRLFVLLALIVCPTARAFYKSSESDTKSLEEAVVGSNKLMQENKKLIEGNSQLMQTLLASVKALKTEQQAEQQGITDIRNHQVLTVENVYHAELCETKYKTMAAGLACPVGRCIYVKEAVYGRRSTVTKCNAKKYDVCIGDFIRSTQILRKGCQGRNSCGFKLDENFGNPCPNTEKILYLQIMCVEC